MLVCFFTARRHAGTVYAVVLCLSVGLSVCLSQVGLLLKRLNVGARKQRHTIALVPKISAKLKWGHPQVSNAGGVG